MVKKIILGALTALTLTSPLYAAGLENFNDYREVGSADDYVRDFEGANFTHYYNRAKAELWADGCDLEIEFKCSDALTEDWQLQHAAAYIVAHLVWNQGYKYKDAIYYVQFLTMHDPTIYNNGSWYHSTAGVYKLKTEDALIKEATNPTKQEFYKEWDDRDKKEFDAWDYILE